MFNTSLRSRTAWASVVPLLGGSEAGWRETNLDGCDVAFQIGRATDRLFRVVLLSTSELSILETATKIERLVHLDGGRRVGIVLLLDGDNATEAYIRMQAKLLLNGLPLPVIPILNPTELPACLADWCRELSGTPARPNPTENPKTLLSYCVHGPPLTERQVNILTDTCSGFRELAHNVHEPQKLQQMADFVGKTDSKRIADFLTRDKPI